MKIESNKVINAPQLIEELKNENISVNSEIAYEYGCFVIDVAAKDEKLTAEIFDKHIAEDWSKKSAIAKEELLAKLGITEEEAKLLLG